MAGAYATYFTQTTFQNVLPNFIGWYFIVAIPFAFCVAALMGWLLEATVIRKLYGRPLDTLLATWGVSLILQQLAPLRYSAPWV
jgi:urea transport system permease protein